MTRTVSRPRLHDAPSANSTRAFPAGHANASVFVLQDRRVVHDAVDDHRGLRRVEEDLGPVRERQLYPTPAGRRGGSALRYILANITGVKIYNDINIGSFYGITIKLTGTGRGFYF